MKLRFGSRATFSPITLEQLLNCFSASVCPPQDRCILYLPHRVADQTETCL